MFPKVTPLFIQKKTILSQESTTPTITISVFLLFFKSVIRTQYESIVQGHYSKNVSMHVGFPFGTVIHPYIQKPLP